jgi:hypothetical protein
MANACLSLKTIYTCFQGVVQLVANYVHLIKRMLLVQILLSHSLEYAKKKKKNFTLELVFSVKAFIFR